MSAPRLSADEKTEIVAAYRRGEKIEAIGAKHGVDTSYVSLLAKRRGLPLRRSKKERKNMSVAALNRAVMA